MSKRWLASLPLCEPSKRQRRDTEVCNGMIENLSLVCPHMDVFSLIVLSSVSHSLYVELYWNESSRKLWKHLSAIGITHSHGNTTKAPPAGIYIEQTQSTKQSSNQAIYQSISHSRCLPLEANMPWSSFRCAPSIAFEYCNKFDPAQCPALMPTSLMCSLTRCSISSVPSFESAGAIRADIRRALSVVPPSDMKYAMRQLTIELAHLSNNTRMKFTSSPPINLKQFPKLVMLSINTGCRGPWLVNLPSNKGLVGSSPLSWPPLAALKIGARYNVFVLPLLTNLQCLEIMNNEPCEIESLEPLKELKQLRHLSCYYEYRGQCTHIAACTSLTSLDLLMFDDAVDCPMRSESLALFSATSPKWRELYIDISDETHYGRAHDAEHRFSLIPLINFTECCQSLVYLNCMGHSPATKEFLQAIRLHLQSGAQQPLFPMLQYLLYSTKIIYEYDVEHSEDSYEDDVESGEDDDGEIIRFVPRTKQRIMDDIEFYSLVGDVMTANRNLTWPRLTHLTMECPLPRHVEYKIFVKHAATERWSHLLPNVCFVDEKCDQLAEKRWKNQWMTSM